MQIIDNKALMVVTRKADQITNLIPKSKILERRGDKAQVLINWGVDECQILRNIGFKNVPHPIRGKYSWPGVYKPMAHQIEMAAFMAANHRCFNLASMGVGKSAATAWAMDYLMQTKKIKRALVLCPLSIMQSAWQADLFKTTMHRTVGIAHGTKAVREKVIAGGYDVVIMNHDGVKTCFRALQQAKFDLIVIDELNVFKTATAERSKTLAKLITPATMVWGMTGTPAAQSPTDAYGLCKIVCPDKVPFYFNRFRDMVMNQITTYKWVPKPNASEVVHQFLQPAIRFTKEECLDLPSITYTDREIALSPMQQKYYTKLKNQMAMDAGGGTVVAAHAAVMLSKLVQISCGAVYDDEGDSIEFEIGPRYTELVNLIEQTERKVILFVPYTHVIEMLETKLTADGITSTVICGSVPLHKRTERFSAFQMDKDPKVIIVQPQSAAHGVTLTAADTVVWWGPITSTETYLQANARAHRHGQTHKVTVVHLFGSPMEKRVYSLLKGNISVHESIVDLYKQEIT